MIRSRSHSNIGNFATDLIEIECEKCGHHGRYSKAALIKRYGGDLVLPDLLKAMSGDCEKKSGPSTQGYGCYLSEAYSAPTRGWLVLLEQHDVPLSAHVTSLHPFPIEQ